VREIVKSLNTALKSHSVKANKYSKHILMGKV